MGRTVKAKTKGCVTGRTDIKRSARDVFVSILEPKGGDWIKRGKSELADTIRLV